MRAAQARACARPCRHDVECAPAHTRTYRRSLMPSFLLPSSPIPLPALPPPRPFAGARTSTFRTAQAWAQATCARRPPTGPAVASRSTWASSSTTLRRRSPRPSQASVPTSPRSAPSVGRPLAASPRCTWPWRGAWATVRASARASSRMLMCVGSCLARAAQARVRLCARASRGCAARALASHRLTQRAAGAALCRPDDVAACIFESPSFWVEEGRLLERVKTRLSSVRPCVHACVPTHIACALPCDCAREQLVARVSARALCARVRPWARHAAPGILRKSAER